MQGTSCQSLPGDCIFVPAGLPHTIGEGVFLVELQEPSDLSGSCWSGPASRWTADARATSGSAWTSRAHGRVAPACQAMSSWSRNGRRGLPPESRPGARTLLPTAASAFFRAERLRPAPAVSLEPAFSILVVVDGDGRLETEGGAATLSRGASLLIPYAAGAGELTGSVDVIRCLPPAPNAGPKP